MAKAGDGVVRVRNGGNLILAIPTADINDARSVMIASERAQLFKVTANGKVQIGTVTTPGDYRLYVERGILTERVKVSLKTTTDWADYVFAKKYKLMPLSEVEKFVKTNKHLPNIPSAEQVVNEGIDLGKMDAKLLEK